MALTKRYTGKLQLSTSDALVTWNLVEVNIHQPRPVAMNCMWIIG